MAKRDEERVDEAQVETLETNAVEPLAATPEDNSANREAGRRVGKRNLQETLQLLTFLLQPIYRTMEQIGTEVAAIAVQLPELKQEDGTTNTRLAALEQKVGNDFAAVGVAVDNIRPSMLNPDEFERGMEQGWQEEFEEFQRRHPQPT